MKQFLKKIYFSIRDIIVRKKLLQWKQLLQRKQVIYIISLFVLLIGLLFFLPRIMSATASFSAAVEKQSSQIWKREICSQNSFLKNFFGADEEYCRKRCAEKHPSAVWCDPKSFDKDVKQDGVITYVAEGGCEIAQMHCEPPDHCPEDALTCMAECPSDPHRMITKKGCECEGNWTPYKERCVCASPYVLREGQCLEVVDKECEYDREFFPSYVACVAPTQQVSIYWKGRFLYECRGACFTTICMTKENKIIGVYWYSRGKFQEKIQMERGHLEAAFSSIGGYYEVCRSTM